MPPPTYIQEVKCRVRRKVLEQAVTMLTTARNQAPVVRKEEFLETLDYATTFLEGFDFARPWIKDLISETDPWLEFYTSQIGQRTPSDLKVLYLCGPEPVNDLEVLLSLGIIPQNIWAIENQANLYKNAIDQLKRHGSNIRIHHGKLDLFFATVNECFDIIYIDACGPLPGAKPNTLSLPIKMVAHERLAPLGMLITNFSEPNSEKRDDYVDLMSQYFSPRYNDFPTALDEDGADPAMAHDDVDYLKQYVSKHFAAVYSDFVTRFIVDLARNIVPQQRIFANLEIRRKFFAAKTKLEEARAKATAPGKYDPDMTPQEIVESIYLTMGELPFNPSGYPIATFLRRAAELPSLKQLLDPLIGPKIDDIKSVDALLAFGLIERMMEGHVDAISPEMLLAVQESWFDERVGLFCDVPMPNLLVNSLFGIYSHPYFPNPRGSIRMSYVAKSTRMYTDCLLFDQCRYYFDFLPTIDLVPDRFRSPAFQLVLRACLDRIGRHDWSSSSHPFCGAALGGFGDFPSAEKYDFRDRIAEAECPPSRS